MLITHEMTTHGLGEPLQFHSIFCKLHNIEILPCLLLWFRALIFREIYSTSFTAIHVWIPIKLQSRDESVALMLASGLVSRDSRNMVVFLPMIPASCLASGGATAYALHSSRSERGNTFEGGISIVIIISVTLMIWNGSTSAQQMDNNNRYTLPSFQFLIMPQKAILSHLQKLFLSQFCW